MKPSWLRWASILAAAILVLVSFIVFFDDDGIGVDRKDEVYEYENKVVTKKGSQSYVKLPDGSEVWLNGDSRLAYHNDFNKAMREVQLIGEGFFDIVENPDKPFLIHAQSVKLKVVGTSFNLRAYPDEHRVETTLISGKVEVTLDKQPHQKIHIQQGEKLTIRNDMLPHEVIDQGTVEISLNEDEPIIQLTKIKTDSEEGVAEQLWKENKLVFDGETFDKVISKIERWYNISVEVKNTSLYSSKFTASFENKTVDQVFNALQYAGKFTYELSNDTVYVY